MTATAALELRTFATIDDVRGDLVDVYADVRSELLLEPGFVASWPTGRAGRLGQHDRMASTPSPPPRKVADPERS